MYNDIGMWFKKDVKVWFLCKVLVGWRVYKRLNVWDYMYILGKWMCNLDLGN